MSEPMTREQLGVDVRHQGGRHQHCAESALAYLDRAETAEREVAALKKGGVRVPDIEFEMRDGRWWAKTTERGITFALPCPDDPQVDDCGRCRWPRPRRGGGRAMRRGMTKAVVAYNLMHGGRVLLVDTTTDEAKRIVQEACAEQLHPYGLCFACPRFAVEEAKPDA